MLKVLAKIVSVLFHPLVMPTLGLLIIFQLSLNVFHLPFEAKRIILTIVGINTLMLPLLIIPMFYRLNIIKTLHMHHHRERVMPLLFTTIPYIFSFYFLNRLPIYSEIPMFMLGASIAVALTLVISIWWKISIHMVGIGGIVGLLFSLYYLYQSNGFSALLIAILFAGIVAWARLYVNAHKPIQVYAGFCLGFCSVIISLVLI